MAIPGIFPPQAVTMGLPIAGASALGATAGQGLMLQHGGIPTAMGIVRAPPMMAGITGAPAPPLPPGAHFGHPMIRPPMGGHPGPQSGNPTRSFYGSQRSYAANRGLPRWNGYNLIIREHNSQET